MAKVHKIGSVFKKVKSLKEKIWQKSKDLLILLLHFNYLKTIHTVSKVCDSLLIHFHLDLVTSASDKNG